VLGLPVPARRAQALARVGAIVEEPSFYPHLTGYENLRVAAAVRGPHTRGRIDHVLDRVGLDNRARDRAGRTVFISSHLLDEIEKTCDLAAIIDGGRVIAQGSIEQLVADEAGELVIECDDAARAVALVAGDRAVRELRIEHGALRMRRSTAGHAGEINSRLVAAGLVVTRLEPARHTLEDRFLEMTTRLEVAA
jgi:ABC-2 type transport system ATP-binding protein